MKWFKHFTNASSSLKLNRVIDELGLEGYAQYWLLLELLAENFDGSNTKITLHQIEISSKVRIKFAKKLATFLQKLADFSLLSYQISGKFYDFEAPILRELQDKESKYNRKRLVRNANLTTLEEDIELDKEEDIIINKGNHESLMMEMGEIITIPQKNLPEKKPQDKLKGPLPCFESNPLAAEFLKDVTHSVQELWIKTYGDKAWLTSEFIKMVNWIAVNPQKAPKLVGRFANHWLTGSWERHRKTIPGQSSGQSHRIQSSISDHEMQRARELGII